MSAESPARMALQTLLGPLLALFCMLATSGLQAQEISDQEACRQPLPPAAYATREAFKAMRYREKVCIKERKAARRRERVAIEQAARTSRRVGVVAGYEGALLFHHLPSELTRRYRSPSFMLGALFRRHYHPRLGLHVLLGPALGQGRIGGAFGTGMGSPSKSKAVGPSFTGLGEVGLVTGPFGGVYVLLAGQARLIVPAKQQASFVFETDDDTLVTKVVRWKSPVLGLGLRAGIGMMLGRRHQYFAEIGGGGGDVLNQGGAYVNVGLRVGWMFGA